MVAGRRFAALAARCRPSGIKARQANPIARPQPTLRSEACPPGAGKNTLAVVLVAARLLSGREKEQSPAAK